MIFTARKELVPQHGRAEVRFHTSSMVNLPTYQAMGHPPYFMGRDMFFHDDTDRTNGLEELSGALVPFTGQLCSPLMREIL
jgi:hypothetical protein